jgi:orotate phosphoribosyltransferase
MTRDEMARRIVDTATLRGEFTLRSGARSNVYFDKYLFESDPVLLREITRAMVPLIPAGTQALAGLEMGGIPLATMLSQHTGLPTLFVRKKAKDYGTCRLAEGGGTANRRIVIVEDVVTSGGQVVLSCADLRKLGAQVDTVLCAIDRQQGGAEALAKIGLTLHPLFRRSELPEV